MALNIGKNNGEAAPAISQPAVEASSRAEAALPWDGIVRAAVQATPRLGELMRQFWGVPVRIRFLGAGQKSHYFWRADDFHVSQLMLGESGEDSSAMALLRLSDAACSSLLARTLGARSAPNKQFSFKRLSPLEAGILNEFSRDILGALMKSVIKKPGRPLKTDPVHLIWVLHVESALMAELEVTAGKQALHFREPVEIGKLVLTLPPHAVKAQSAPEAASPDTWVPDDFFYHVQGPARLSLGSTRMTLADLNQLEPEDIVVLEQSDSSRMAVIEPGSGEPLFFTCEISRRQRLTLPYMQQEFADMETQQSVSARQSLWDNLMIEVSAEFEPVKLPLKQLKQMSEGLVVEIGDLVNNRICLQVDGKTLAWGELIIVGDKFGIRVSKVDAAGQGADAPVQAAESVQALAPVQAVQEPQAAETPEADSGENPDTFLNDDFDDFEDFDDDDL